MEQQPIWTFLPGLHGTPELFSEIQHALPSDVKSEFIELPAEGKQDYPQLRDWLESQLSPGVPRILIAESFSGPLALDYSEKNPHAVCGIILAASFCSSPLPRFLAMLPLQLLFSLHPPQFLIQYFLIGKDSDQNQLTPLDAAIQKTSPHVMANRVRAILKLQQQNRPSLPDTPIMLLQAQNDNLIGSKTQQYLQSAYPHAHVHYISSPHLILQREPLLCLEHILNFVAALK